MIVTPYLSKDAELAARGHMQGSKMPVFIMAVNLDENDERCAGYCKNCAGLGIIYLRLTEKGPFQTPPTTQKVITWFDGSELYGKGWYIVGNTQPFQCPECKGNGSKNGRLR